MRPEPIWFLRPWIGRAAISSQPNPDNSFNKEGIVGKINYGRVVLGGLVAGIVATLLDWFSNAVLMGQLWVDAMKSLNRPMLMTGQVLGGGLLLELVGGIVAVWTYAAIRPRFGAGARTAAYAGL